MRDKNIQPIGSANGITAGEEMDLSKSDPLARLAEDARLLRPLSPAHCYLVYQEHLHLHQQRLEIISAALEKILFESNMAAARLMALDALRKSQKRLYYTDILNESED